MTPIQYELAQQTAQNNKLLELLSKMERLWPENERGKVTALRIRVEETRNLLRDCKKLLEERK